MAWLPAWLVLSLSLSSALSVSAHDLALGSSRFVLDEKGVVAIEIDMEARDVLELLDVDVALPEEAALLERRAEVLTRYLRVHADGARCPLGAPRWQPVPPGGVRFSFEARCRAAPERLSIDWGLSTLTPLDLRSAATLSAPGGIVHTTLLARRSPHVDVVVTRPSTAKTLARFFVLGLEHILLGWDHLAFLLAVLLGCARYRRLLLVVSGFTLAHSLTLVLGALGAVRLSPGVVEPVIAASIAVAALIAGARLLRGSLAHPGSPLEPGDVTTELALVAGFGLIHGLGFASMLEEALGESVDVLVPLVGFNVGVELGQIAAVSLAYPLLVVVGRRELARALFLALLAGLLALGAWAAVDRLLGG